MTKRRFSDLSPVQRVFVVVVGSVQLALNLAAQLDITRRPASAIRGPKIRWRLISMINIFGPLAYFRWGRTSRPDDAG